MYYLIQNTSSSKPKQHCSTSSPKLCNHSAMADEEPVDQKRYLEDSCKPKCVKPLLEYQACIKRIHGDESGQKHCTGQYFDYWFCIDKCVAPRLFTKLK
ncbi:hypothetical protein VNO80_28413 [Phaseolus coccineus]|uniref:Complex III subunit VI n=1 Tax=Phaseolus coccineus TaxID=3886 RepID=A0AAN9LAB9_PHACN